MTSLLWVLAARRLFLIPYVGLAILFLMGFSWATALDVTKLLVTNWAWGVIAGVVVGAFTVVNVRSQPASRESAGGELLFDIAWLGVAYGLMDALFLNVMPVVTVWNWIAPTGLWSTRIAVGALALGASLMVALVYHLGYPEYRNRSVGLVLIGNGLITLAFLVSGNPLGAIISHTVMHVAAVIQGPETTIQLPPHRTMIIRRSYTGRPTLPVDEKGSPRLGL